MNLDNRAGHLCFWNRGWRTSLSRLSEVNVSDWHCIKTLWYSKGLRGTVATGLGAEEYQAMLSDLSQQLKVVRHCHKMSRVIAFILVAQARDKLRRTSAQELVYFFFFFKCVKYMLHSNISKTVKLSGKRKVFINCPLHKFSEQRKAGSLLSGHQIIVACQHRYWIWSNILEVLQSNRPLHLLRVLQTVQNCTLVFLYNGNGSKSHFALLIAFYFGAVNLEIYISSQT